MGQENPGKQQQLFMYMVGTFQSSAWIALRKMKNQMTEKFEKNLEQAFSYIALLDMLQSKTKGNVLEYEEQMLINMVSELKMNIIDEQKNTNSTARTKEQESEDSTGEEE